MTDDFGARSVVQIISWFNPWVRSFGTRQILQALDYLGLDEAERTDVLAVAIRLRGHLRGPIPPPPSFP